MQSPDCALEQFFLEIHGGRCLAEVSYQSDCDGLLAVDGLAVCRSNLEYHLYQFALAGLTAIQCPMKLIEQALALQGMYFRGWTLRGYDARVGYQCVHDIDNLCLEVLV